MVNQRLLEYEIYGDRRFYFNDCSIVTITANPADRSYIFYHRPSLQGKMASKICACSGKENHAVPNGIAAVGEEAETAPKLTDISNQWTEKPRKKCGHAEQLEGIKGLETNTTAQSDEERGRTKCEGQEIWTDIPLNDPDEELEASDRATWLVVEKRKFICRSMSPEPYPRRRPQRENGNEIHDGKN